MCAACRRGLLVPWVYSGDSWRRRSSSRIFCRSEAVCGEISPSIDRAASTGEGAVTEPFAGMACTLFGTIAWLESVAAGTSSNSPRYSASSLRRCASRRLLRASAAASCVRRSACRLRSDCASSCLRLSRSLAASWRLTASLACRHSASYLVSDRLRPQITIMASSKRGFSMNSATETGGGSSAQAARKNKPHIALIISGNFIS